MNRKIKLAIYEIIRVNNERSVVLSSRRNLLKEIDQLNLRATRLAEIEQEGIKNLHSVLFDFMLTVSVGRFLKVLKMALNEIKHI